MWILLDIYTKLLDIYTVMHLLTTMGMGRVRMKVPASAQKPPSSLPVKVCGDLNRKIFIIQKKYFHLT